MKKTVGIALIALGLTSCGSGNYIPCPAYGSNSNDNYYETEAIHQDLTDKELEELVATIECENCDEID